MMVDNSIATTLPLALKPFAGPREMTPKFILRGVTLLYRILIH